MSINIKIQRKDLWLLAAIVMFLVGVGFIIAYNSGADPSVMGHSAEELEGVCRSDGTNCLAVNYRIKTGQFTGNGASQTINIGFQPTNIVIQRAGNNRHWWTKETTDAGGIFAVATGGIKTYNCITAVTTSGFSVGNDGNCNNNNEIIYYTAIKE